MIIKMFKIGEVYEKAQQLW